LISCNDDNACTTDFCNANGCQNIQEFTCDDHNGCTLDYCNASSGSCYHVSIAENCSSLNDYCDIVYCDPRAPSDDHCFNQPIPCPHVNNCTVSICYKEAIWNPYANVSGCYNRSLDCTSWIGLIAGLAGGVVAAITVGAAALFVGAATAAGTAFAVSANHPVPDQTCVNQNPMYKHHGKVNEVTI